MFSCFSRLQYYRYLKESMAMGFALTIMQTYAGRDILPSPDALAKKAVEYADALRAALQEQPLYPNKQEANQSTITQDDF